MYMKNVEEALVRLYRIARKMKKATEALESIGFGNELTQDAWDEAADGIYHLIGENTETFEESKTALVLNTCSLSEERAVAMLLGEYKRNFRQPKPNLMDPKDMEKMVQENGGYMHSTPEGDWRK